MANGNRTPGNSGNGGGNTSPCPANRLSISPIDKPLHDFDLARPGGNHSRHTTRACILPFH
jgi:hypothetical protein